MAACRTVLPFVDGDLLAVDGQRHGFHTEPIISGSAWRGGRRRARMPPYAAQFASDSCGDVRASSRRTSTAPGSLDTPPLRGVASRSDASLPPEAVMQATRIRLHLGATYRVGGGGASSSSPLSASPRSSSGSSGPHRARRSPRRSWRRPRRSRRRCPRARSRCPASCCSMGGRFASATRSSHVDEIVSWRLSAGHAGRRSRRARRAGHAVL